VRALEEVEQYVSMGFVDDARDALRELVARFPGHSLLAAKVAELGVEPEPAAARAHAAPLEPPPDAEDAFAELGLPDTAAMAGPRGGGMDDLLGAREIPGDGRQSRSAPPAAFAAEEAGGLDLGSELGELFGAQSAVEEAAGAGSATELGDSGLADIFKEFKKGVDKQLGKEDYDTRYNLGIAYKEMGLTDEAIGEFQYASKDPSKFLQCCILLGACFTEKGMPELSIGWYEKGLQAPDLTDEDRLALIYEIAVCREAMGDDQGALKQLVAIYGQDARYRDVAARVARLKQKVGR
jgi:tetratricopeptide (TPR) repeat protein